MRNQRATWLSRLEKNEPNVGRSDRSTPNNEKRSKKFSRLEGCVGGGGGNPPEGTGTRPGENVVKQCHLSSLTSLVRGSLRAPASRDITRGIAALGGSRSTRARAVCPAIRNGHDAGSHVAADADGIDRSAIQGVTRLTTTLGAIVCRSSEELGALKIPRVPSMVRK